MGVSNSCCCGSYLRKKFTFYSLVRIIFCFSVSCYARCYECFPFLFALLKCFKLCWNFHIVLLTADQFQINLSSSSNISWSVSNKGKKPSIYRLPKTELIVCNSSWLYLVDEGEQFSRRPYYTYILMLSYCVLGVQP